MWQEVLTFVLNSIRTIADIWVWLTTPLLVGKDWLTPLSIIGGAGFAIILSFWIFKLVNPLS